MGAAAGERLVRTGLAEDAPVELRVHAELVGVRRASPHLAGGDSVGCQRRQPGAKARIDVPFEDFRGGVNVGIGVERAKSGPHGRLLRSC